MRVLAKHPGDNSLKLIRVFTWDPFKLSCLDLHSEGEMVLSLKRRMQCCSLIDYTPKRPYITLVIVFAFINLLWRHVVRRTYVSVSELGFFIHHSSQAKITYLHIAIGI